MCRLLGHRLAGYTGGEFDFCIRCRKSFVPRVYAVDP